MPAHLRVFCTCHEYTRTILVYDSKESQIATEKKVIYKRKKQHKQSLSPVFCCFEKEKKTVFDAAIEIILIVFEKQIHCFCADRQLREL